MARSIKFISEVRQSVVTICKVCCTGSTLEEISFPKTAVINGQRVAVRGISLDEESRLLLNGVKRIVLPEGLREIGGDCFRELKELEEVEFPTTLTTIRVNAFKGCHRLKSVMLPESVTKIGCAAFSQIGSSRRGTRIYVPANAVLEDEAFACARISHAQVECPRIGVKAFEKTKFRSLSLSPVLEEIGNYSFCQSNALYLIGRLPQTLKVIQPGAFSKACFLNYKYTTLEIPDGVVVESNAFYKAKFLRRIFTGDSTWRSIMGALFSLANSGIETVKIPEGTTTIGNSVCSGCKNIKSVYFPLSVSYIRESAFKGSGLKSVVITNRYASVEYCAFADMNDCEYIDAAANVWSYSLVTRQCISGCGMAHVTVPEGVKALGTRAFFDSYRLKSVSLPRSLERVADYTFANCTQLREAKLGPNVTFIGDCSFARCHSLRNVILPEGLTIIGVYAFASCRSLTELVLPSTVNKIGEGCFTACYALKALVLMMEPGRESYPWDCPTLVTWYVPDEWVAMAQSMNKEPERRILPLSAYKPCPPLASEAVPEGYRRVRLTLYSNDFSDYGLLLSFKVRPEHLPMLEQSIGPSLLLSRYILQNMAEGELRPIVPISGYADFSCYIYDQKNGTELFELKELESMSSGESPLSLDDPVVMCNVSTRYVADYYIDLPKDETFDKHKLKLHECKFGDIEVADMSGVFYDGVWYPCSLDLSMADIPYHRNNKRVIFTNQIYVNSGGAFRQVPIKECRVVVDGMEEKDLFNQPMKTPKRCLSLLR